MRIRLCMGVCGCECVYVCVSMSSCVCECSTPASLQNQMYFNGPSDEHRAYNVPLMGHGWWGTHVQAFAEVSVASKWHVPIYGNSCPSEVPTVHTHLELQRQIQTCCTGQLCQSRRRNQSRCYHVSAADHQPSNILLLGDTCNVCTYCTP